MAILNFGGVEEEVITLQRISIKERYRLYKRRDSVNIRIWTTGESTILEPKRQWG